MSGEPIRSVLEVFLGGMVVSLVACFVLVNLVLARRGLLKRRNLIIGALANLPTVAAFSALFLLVYRGALPGTALGAVCIGGLAVLFFVLHVTLMLLGFGRGRLWLRRRWGERP